MAKMIEEICIDSNDNTLFVTAQCNNNCLMCCQPPQIKDDIDVFYQKNINIIESAPSEIKDIGISGGEPTLLGDKLISLIQRIRNKYRNAHIHILSNGRAFKDYGFTCRLKEAAVDNITVGIPLHSDYEKDHDYIAGCKGAYKETMYGLYNLFDFGIEIELRVVINKVNYVRLPHISNFIFKNLPFVAWVAFMAMEDIGFTNKNREIVWSEPIEYRDELEKAVSELSEWNFDVSIYNIPLCLAKDSIKQFTQKSISDWKTRYMPFCDECAMKDRCCGLFATSKSIYKGLKPIKQWKCGNI